MKTDKNVLAKDHCLAISLDVARSIQLTIEVPSAFIIIMEAWNILVQESTDGLIARCPFNE